MWCYTIFRLWKFKISFNDSYFQGTAKHSKLMHLDWNNHLIFSRLPRLLITCNLTPRTFNQLNKGSKGDGFHFMCYKLPSYIESLLLLIGKETLSYLAGDENKLLNLTILGLLLVSAIRQRELELRHEFSTGDNFATLGIFNNVWRYFWLAQLGRRCYWHLVGRN